MNSDSKPLLIDIYVNKRNNNEYISSTILLKKGDDLRKDCYISYMFRLMNFLWSENNIHFMDVSVQILTYKCISIAPNICIIYYFLFVCIIFFFYLFFCFLKIE